MHYPSGTRFFGVSGPRVSGGRALSFTPPEAPALAGPIPPSRSTTITYTYDKLYRLKTADYDSGRFYHYTYDAAGNRLTQEMELLTNSYAYDSANRLTSVDGQAYTYDNNGNLLSDGASTYTYDHANQLTSVSQGAVSYSYAYNGMGDRLQQTVDSVTTEYTLDLNTGLTQVLTDGTDTYLYGLGRIGEYDSANWTYPLTDALGSVRQLTDANGAPVLTQSYAPYGDVQESYGAASSNYGFAGEWTDGTGLQHLRARYLNTGIGRFISRDTWGGDYNRPMSLNRWGYVEGNPVNHVDPSGRLRVSIWAAAFISPPQITFMHQYFPSEPTPGPNPFPILVDLNAKWHGDNRGFYNGSGTTSSRMWNQVILEFNDAGVPIVVHNESGIGTTTVTYYDTVVGKYITQSGRAQKPKVAEVRYENQCSTIVNMETSASNPLTPPGITPDINYEYKLKFDLCNKIVSATGKHDKFPWHELHINGLDPFVNYPPNPNYTPLHLSPLVGRIPVDVVRSLTQLDLSTNDVNSQSNQIFLPEGSPHILFDLIC